MKHTLPLLAILWTASGLCAQDTFTCRGRVLDARCQPLAGAGILVGPVDQVLTATALEQPTVRTGADGSFVVTLPTALLATRQHCLLVAAAGKVALQQPMVAKWTLAMQQLTEATLPDLILEDGTTLKGRVRTADGKPLAGARVTARDLVTGHGLSPWTEQHTPRPQSHALTGADGTFTLPGTHQSALEVLVDCPGFYRQHLLPVCDKDPLVLEPAPSGFVRGTLQGPDGKPRGGILKLVSEVSAEEQETTVPASGAFALPLRFRGRYRLQCLARAGMGLSWFESRRVAGESAVLTGPADGVVVRSKPGHVGTLRVRAVDAAGKPVPGFTAGVNWIDAEWFGATDLGDLDSRDDVPAGADGVALLPGPDEEQSNAKALLRIRAPGLVPCVRKSIPWEKDGQEVVVKLEPEAVLAGRVVDPRTGAGIAGAEVRAVLPASGDTEERVLQFLRMARLGRVTRTGADGSFRLGGLPKGRFQVFAQAPGRPEAKALQVTLETAQTRADLKVPLPAGASVAGTLSSATAPPGARVVRYEAPGMLSSITMVMGSMFYPGDVAQTRQGAPVQKDQSFRLDGLPAGSTDLGLEVPLPLRNGPALVRKLEGVRLDAGEVLEEDFDLRPALPAVVAGRVVLEGDPMPIGRVYVRASLADPNVVQAMASQLGFDGQEWCAVPEPDGSFRLFVPSGNVKLRVVDVVTGVEFVHDEVKVAAGQSTPRELRCTVAKARVRLDAGGQAPVVAERLVLQTGGQEEANQLSLMALFGTWGGIGVPLSCGTREVDVFVPPGTVTLKVLSGAQRLASGNQHEEPAVLGELEFEAKVGEQPVLSVVVGAAPEVK